MRPERFSGAILGVALGDAVGRPFEGSARVSMEEVVREIERSRILKFTDDTQMTLDLARSLVERRGFDPGHVMEKFAKSYDPSRGYGLTTTYVIQKVKAGESWERASREVMGGEGSYGNGAAMRVSPVGLVYQHDVEKMKEFAEASSILTHAHSLGIQGAVLQALAVATLAQSTVEEFKGEEFLGSLREAVKSDVYSQKLARVKELLRERVPPEEAGEELGHGSEAFNSIPIAFFCFLKFPFDFRKAVLSAVALGGDSDTIGSMTGCLSGAFLGISALPSEWLEKLEGREDLESIGRELFLLHVSEVLGKRCEMCLVEENVGVYKVDPEGADEISNFILLCDRCRLESERERKEFLARPRKRGKYRAVYRKAYRRS